MNKYEWANFMQKVDQHAAESKRQTQADFQSLRAAHSVFDDIAEESALMLAELKGEVPKNKNDRPTVINATIIDADWDDSSDDDW